MPLRLPEPDLLLSFGGGCVPAMKIFQILEEKFPRARVFRADLPQVPLEEIKEYHLDYAVGVLKELIAFLERATGRRLDYGRLEEVVSLSDRACALWDEIMSCRGTVPAPFSAAEIGLMFVMVTLQGTAEAVDFLTRVRDEVREKSLRKEGVIPREELRLFWDNIPLWYNLKLFNYFERFNAVVVAETYSAAWSLRLDPARPLESLAYKSLVSYPLVSCVSLRRRKEMVLEACRNYHIDGVILHSNKSCKPITLGQMLIKEALKRELGLPAVVIDADHMDARHFSAGQFESRVEAFIELLRGNRLNRQ
jgi:benzoyl-CoA reductase/2-hydroxyglutaryl-CoA dehydratase subunit BcrC/BadD/HgdB